MSQSLIRHLTDTIEELEKRVKQLEEQLYILRTQNTLYKSLDYVVGSKG